MKAGGLVVRSLSDFNDRGEPSQQFLATTPNLK
jgi:hypothetical protein